MGVDERLIGQIDAQIKIVLKEQKEMREWLQQARRDNTESHGRLHDLLRSTSSALAELSGKFEVHVEDVNRRINHVWQVFFAAWAAAIALIGALKLW